MLNKRLTALAAIGAGLSAALITSTAAAGYTYRQNYLLNWSSCAAGCNTAPTLTYTGSVVANWDSAMTGLGNTRLSSFTGVDVWASDLVEDRDFGGTDASYSDDADIYVYSGHGNPDNSNPWGETFTAPFCSAGTMTTLTTGGYPSCTYDSERSRLGERNTYYASPSPGKLRYIMLATCYSVNTSPDQQWGQSFWFGLDMVFGYRGISADSWYTDDSLSSLAEEGWGTNASMKSAWFYAVDEYWVDDTGGLFASGVNGSHAAARRDGMNRTWGPRADGEVHTSFAWSHYDG